MRVRSAESLLTQSELVMKSTPPLRNRMSKVCWIPALYTFTTCKHTQTHMCTNQHEATQNSLKKKKKKHPSCSKAVNMVCNLHVKCIILYCIEAIHDAFITHFTFFIAHFFSCMNTQCSRRGAIKRKKGNIWTSALKAGWQEDNYSVSVTFPTKTQSVICGFLSACFYYCCTVARIQAAVSCWSILTTTYIHFDI